MRILHPTRLGLPGKFAAGWRPAQQLAIGNVLLGEKQYDGLNAPTGFGKCLAPETLVLRYDGQITRADEVNCGDLLMGPDSKPRRVLSTTSGWDQMYEIQPVRGAPWRCNAGHIFTLVGTETGAVEDIELSDYLTRSKWYKHTRKLFSVGVDFGGSKETLPIDPYFLGVWFGGGCKDLKHGVRITSADTEIVSYLHRFADHWGLRIREERQLGNQASVYCLTQREKRKGSNGLKTVLMELVGPDCEVPPAYLTASRQARARFLAGWLDTGGHYIKGCFDFVQKRPEYASAVSFLARSLGLKVVECLKKIRTGPYAGNVYQRLTISGDTDQIPTLIHRKQAGPRRQIKNACRTGFKVAEVGRGPYVGFTLDDDGRFLLGDFTVTHNSGLMYGVAQMIPREERVAILTSTKALQNIIRDEARVIGARDMRGKGNYRCLAVDGGEVALVTESQSAEAAEASGGSLGGFVSVEHGPCFTSNIECSLAKGGCTWFDALGAAKSARIVLTNYAKWISTRDIEKELGKFDWLFCDEADNAEGHLADHLRIELRRSEAESLLGAHWPGSAAETRLADWQEWARHYEPRAKQLVADGESALRERMAASGRPPREFLGRLTALRRLAESLGALARLKGDWVHDDWRVFERQVGVQFDPITPAPYAAGLLFRGVGRVVLMSATLRERDLDALGIKREERTWSEYASTFPVMRRPVYFWQIAGLRLNKQTESQEDVRRRVAALGDELIAARLDRRGLVHTFSYARARYLVQYSQYRELLITHPSGSGEAERALERYTKAAPPVVLMSPSFDTGHDFAFELAEWCWIPKMPFVDRSPAVVQARLERDPKYCDALVAKKIVQMCGRIMRDQADSGESIVSDPLFGWHPWANRELYPQYFLAAIRKVQAAPRPLAKLRPRARSGGGE